MTDTQAAGSQERIHLQRPGCLASMLAGCRGEVSTALGVPTARVAPVSHFCLCSQPGFPPPLGGNDRHSFPTLPGVGKEATGVDVICVVLSSAAGDTERETVPDVPSSTLGDRPRQREIPLQGESLPSSPSH